MCQDRCGLCSSDGSGDDVDAGDGRGWTGMGLSAPPEKRDGVGASSSRKLEPHAGGSRNTASAMVGRCGSLRAGRQGAVEVANVTAYFGL